MWIDGSNRHNNRHTYTHTTAEIIIHASSWIPHHFTNTHTHTHTARMAFKAIASYMGKDKSPK